MTFKNSIIGFFVLILTSCQVKETIDADIIYKITSNFDEQPSIQVEFNYTTDKNGWLKLDYLNNSWGDNDIFNCIKELKVKNTEAQVTFVKDSNLIKIKSDPQKELQVSYTIIQDFKAPVYNHHRYRPIISKDYFHILGMRLFIVPTTIYQKETDTAKIHIKWKGVSENKLFHSSFGTEKEQTFNVHQEDLFASFFVGGDFRRYQFDYLGKPVYFVTRGEWVSFTDDQIVETLKETVNFQNNFWKDSIEDMFSVSLIPTDEKGGYSVGGSGFSNSFISFASNNKSTEKQRISWLYSHELLHKWIGRTIKNENEVQQYWFSEGFTDYYAYKLLLKNNKLSLQEYLNSLNTILKNHEKDPIKNIPNAELTFSKYWGNYALYQKLPYRRGLLYAFLLDAQIKTKHNFNQSLDNLMLELLTMAKLDPDMKINEALFEKMLVKYLDESAVDAFRKYIIKGELIDFNKKNFDGITMKRKNGTSVFDFDKTQSKRLLKQLQH